MGCAGSKLDDLEAVALCRYRSQHLADAIHHRYALADAHASYIQCLQSVAVSLHRFFLVTEQIPPPSPVLTLPTQRKGDPLPPFSPIYHHPIASPSPPPPAIHNSVPSDVPMGTVHSHSDSNSGSHLQFHSSSSEEDDDGPFHSDHSPPMTITTKTYFNFSRKGTPSTSVTCEQGLVNPNAAPVHVGGFDVGGDPTSSTSHGYYFPDPYMKQSPNYYGSGAGTRYPYAYPYPYDYGSMGGGFFGSSLPPKAASPPRGASSSSSRAPPPPPSPPRGSSWDFFNPFESYESYQQTYTPSRSSKDLREEEGIPDLEDEEQVVVKKAYGDQKFVAGASSSGSSAGDMHSGENGRRSTGEEIRYQARASGARDSEVHLTDENIVVDDALQQQSEVRARRKVVPGSRSVPDGLHEMKVQFDRASASCEEIGKMLEVGKLPYHKRKYEVVSSKVMHAITPSLSTAASSQISASKNGEQTDIANSVYLEFDEEKGMKSGNLSSTLQKLYIWEKKLLEEVLAEEKMRLRHDRKRKQLKRLDDRGAEAHKIDSTRALIMKLSTKIRIAIQVVDSISIRINNLRDDDLWPQLHELINGLVRMWHVMTECYRSQYQTVIESYSLDAVASAFAGNLSDAHMEATMHLVLELLGWIEVFSSWIDAQKSYIKSLNGWLMKCLPDEQEETADGIAPFSPGRLGAPPIFVICNQWAQAIDRISEREVVEAMQSFMTSVLQIWRQHYDGRRQRMLAIRDMDRRVKALEREDQKIQKAVDTINKRRALVASHNGLPYAGDIIHMNHAAEPSSLHMALQHIFEAVERFSESSLKIYEELQERCEEEKASRRECKSCVRPN